MNAKSHLSVVGNPNTSALAKLADPQTGSLAEAEALADALSIATTGPAQMREDSLATLSKMLVDRLDQVRAVVEAEAARQDGAA